MKYDTQLWDDLEAVLPTSDFAAAKELPDEYLEQLYKKERVYGFEWARFNQIIEQFIFFSKHPEDELGQQVKFLVYPNCFDWVSFSWVEAMEEPTRTHYIWRKIQQAGMELIVLNIWDYIHNMRPNFTLKNVAHNVDIWTDNELFPLAVGLAMRHRIGVNMGGYDTFTQEDYNWLTRLYYMAAGRPHSDDSRRIISS
jgi:hypothetical protein